MIIGTVGGLLAWLMANGGTLIAAGTSIAGVVKSFLKLWGTTDPDKPVTKEEFDKFVAESLGDDGRRLALMAQAQGDLGPVA